MVNQNQSQTPISTGHLVPATHPLRFRAEAQLRSAKLGRWWISALWNWLLNLVFRKSLLKGLTTAGIDWGQYRKELLDRTDSMEYDEALRLVADLDSNAEAQLRACLEKWQAKGVLNYGLHVSTEALMTCMVFDRKANHVHLIDGGGGGYTQASVQMKSSAKKQAN